MNEYEAAKEKLKASEDGQNVRRILKFEYSFHVKVC